MTATAARPTSPLSTADQTRRFAVVAAEIFCVVGTLFGIGVLGTRVEESSGGALAATATLVAPAGPAFSIWTPIYLGLLGYAVWQLAPANAVRERVRSTGWLAAASMVLNALWLLVTQQGWIWVSVVVIVALAFTLGVLVLRLTREAPRSTWERVLLDGTFGLYLGWVAVATCANVTAALVAIENLGGLENQVTELDVNVYDDPTSCYQNGTGCLASYGATLPLSVQSRQARLYRQLYAAFKRSSVQSVTTWGLHDGHSWLNAPEYQRTNFPLLFDASGNPKWAFWAVVDSSITLP